MTKTCNYCGADINHRPKSAEHCNDTHKEYAYLVRKGLKAPFIKPDEVNKEENQLSDLDKEKIQREIEEVDNLINQVKKEHEELIFKRNSIQRKSDFRIKKRLGEISSVYRTSDKKRALLKEKETLEKELVEIEVYNKEIRKSILSMDEEIHTLFLKIFRSNERRSDLYSKLISKTDITGNDLKTYLDTKIYFPFDELDHRFFIEIGKLPKPFLASIVGEPSKGKSILGTLIALELSNVFKSNILYAVDDMNEESVLRYFSIKDTNSDKINITIAENFESIERRLLKADYEFLFIDSIGNLNVRFHMIRKIQKQFPKISIFCINRNKIKEFLVNSHITFNARTVQVQEDIYNGYAEVFLRDKPNEERECSIFLNNPMNGFLPTLV